MKVAKIGDLCDIYGGIAAPTSEEAYDEIGIPFVRMRDLGRDHITNNLVNTENKIKFDYAKRKKLSIVRKGSVLIPRSGSVSLNHRAILGVDGIIVSHIWALTVKDNRLIDSSFLFYSLVNIDLGKVARKTTGLDLITFKDLRNISINLPPLDTQKELVSILDQAQLITDNRKKTIHLLDKFLSDSFLDTFNDPGTNKKNWEKKLLKELVDPANKICYGVVQPGIDFPNGVPIIRISDFQGLKVNSIETKKIDPNIEKKYAKSRIKGDEILIACVGATIGKIALADDTLKGFNIVRATARVVCGKKINRYYLAYYLSTYYVQSYFAKVTRSVSQPTLNIKHIEETPVLLPPMALQRKFESLFIKCDKIRNWLNKSLYTNEELFKSLLFHGLQGQLKVNSNKIRLKNVFDTFSWLDDQLQLLSQTSRIKNFRKKLHEIERIRHEVNNFERLSEQLGKRNLPSIKEFEDFRNRLRVFGIEEFGKVKMYEEFNVLRSDHFVDQLGLKEEFNLMNYGGLTDVNGREIENEIDDVDDIVFKLLGESQVGKLKFGIYKINVAAVIMKFFHGEEFDVDAAQKVLEEDEAITVNGEELKKEVFRIIDAFAREEFAKTPFLFVELRKRLTSKLFNPTFTLLKEYIYSQISTNKITQEYIVSERKEHSKIHLFLTYEAN
jgi:type I restriction enzyme, S subunit